jgi:hypothetical protein
MFLLRHTGSKRNYCRLTMIRHNPVRPNRPDFLCKTSHNVQHAEPA